MSAVGGQGRDASLCMRASRSIIFGSVLFVARSRAPASMSPDPLTGTGPNFLFDHVGDLLEVPAQYLFVIGCSGLELEGRIDSQAMTSSVRIPMHERGDDGNTTQRITIPFCR